MTEELNGFTIQTKISATCPNGHTFYVQAEIPVGPCKYKDLDQYQGSIMYILEGAWRTLEKAECQECKKEKNTKWRT